MNEFHEHTTARSRLLRVQSMIHRGHLGPIWDRWTSKQSTSTANHSKLFHDIFDCQISSYGITVALPIAYERHVTRIPASPPDSSGLVASRIIGGG